MQNFPTKNELTEKKLSVLRRIDKEFIDKLILENKKVKGFKIVCTCSTCKVIRENKYYYKPNACFIETNVGWKYTCRKCDSTLWMYEYLTKTNNKNDAREYVKALWENSIFGYGWNYPNYPKSLLIRLYSELEDVKRESNYQMKYQSSMS